MWLRRIEIWRAKPVIQKTAAQLVFAKTQVRVDDEVMLVGKIGCDGLNCAHWNCLSVHDDSRVRSCRDWELTQYVANRTVVRE